MNTTTLHDHEDTPIIRDIQKILFQAVEKKASDIHFEPNEKYYRVRFRIDGILYEITQFTLNLTNRITSCIKIMAQLDIAERRIPQDGRFKINHSTMNDIDFRVSTCPTLHGEKVVIRILDSKTNLLNIEKLGFSTTQQNIFLSAVNKPQGLILVTGPTGSGKTVTLYNALNLLNTTQVNLLTVEDPIEINIQHINQVNINPKAGLTFATALRAFLRQDPDIIMIGEMRDLETAEIAIKAAQTGHLVLSTLHTNSAAESITRLINMGISNYNIASSVNLIMAQRLLRCLCQHCKKQQYLPHHILLQEGFEENEIEHLTTYQASSCEHCVNGYSGRIGVFELLDCNEFILKSILNQASALDILQQAKNNGMQTLREVALDKVKQGVTSLAEANRVT